MTNSKSHGILLFKRNQSKCRPITLETFNHQIYSKKPIKTRLSDVWKTFSMHPKKYAKSPTKLLQRNWSWKRWKKIEKKYFFVSFKFFSFLYFISKKIYTFVIEFFLLWMNTWNFGNFINWKRDAQSRKTLKNLKTKNSSFMKSAAKKQQNNFFHFKTF